MSTSAAFSPPPPLTPPARLRAQLASPGFAVLAASATARLAGWSALPTDWHERWDRLPPDRHLLDGGRYRRRRHGCFFASARAVEPAPHRAHWQSLDYNALHGGIERWFEPLEPDWAADARVLALLRALAGLADTLPADPGRPTSNAEAEADGRWAVEVHPFRIDTTDGIGRPTPEGAHRDGVDLVAVMLLARVGIKGGETRVFDAHAPEGLRFTLDEPFSMLLLDDRRMIHESTPIQPIDATQPAHRDTLVVTLRRGGFQGPDDDADAR